MIEFELDAALELDWGAFLHAEVVEDDEAEKAYNPDQLRAPAQTPIGGRWVNENYDGLRVIDGKPQGGIPAKYNKAKKRWEAEGVDQERLDAMAIPPAWENVRVDEDPKADLQVLGQDAKGRAQYRYSEAFAQSQAARKFQRVALLNAKMGDLDKATRKGIGAGDDDAAAARLIMQTGMRPGSDEDTGAEKKAYGATTLLKKHVKVDGNTVSYSFVGKKGVAIKGEVTDPLLARYVAGRLDASDGPDLFRTSAGRVNAFIKESVGSDYKAKDLRTHRANASAASFVRDMPRPKTTREYTSYRNTVGDRVAAQLGNTRSVALKDYINPIVFKAWEPPG